MRQVKRVHLCLFIVAWIHHFHDNACRIRLKFEQRDRCHNMQTTLNPYILSWQFVGRARKLREWACGWKIMCRVKGSWNLLPRTPPPIIGQTCFASLAVQLKPETMTITHVYSYTRQIKSRKTGKILILSGLLSKSKPNIGNYPMMEGGAGGCIHQCFLALVYFHPSFPLI